MSRRPFRQWAGLVGACVALAVALAGCGGGGHSSGPPLSKAAYQTRMAAFGKQLGGALGSLGSVHTVPAAEAALGKLQREFAATDKALGAITPPADVAAAHAKLVAALGEFSGELGSLITELKAGKLESLGTVFALKGMSDIESAAKAITKDGYTIKG